MLNSYSAILDTPTYPNHTPYVLSSDRHPVIWHTSVTGHLLCVRCTVHRDMYSVSREPQPVRGAATLPELSAALAHCHPHLCHCHPAQVGVVSECIFACFYIPGYVLSPLSPCIPHTHTLTPVHLDRFVVRSLQCSLSPDEVTQAVLASRQHRQSSLSRLRDWFMSWWRPREEHHTSPSPSLASYR